MSRIIINSPLIVRALTERSEEERKNLYFVSDETVSEVPFVRVCTKRNLESDEMSDYPVYEFQIVGIMKKFLD